MERAVGSVAVVQSGIRQCSRNGCRNAAVATLTYVYRDQTAVLGPLAASAEPHTYDLCAPHAERLTAPRGWEVVRLDPEIDLSRNDDDIAALADAVREAAAAPVEGRMRTTAPAPVTGPPAAPPRRGHLRMVREAHYLPE